MENNTTNTEAGNKNLIYIIGFLILGVVVGYLLAGSKLNTQNQGAQSISSGYEDGRQKGAEDVDEVLLKFFGSPIKKYDLTSKEGARDFAQSIGVPFYDLESGDVPPGGNELPVTCYEYDLLSGSLTGNSYSSGNVGVTLSGFTLTYCSATIF